MWKLSETAKRHDFGFGFLIQTPHEYYTDTKYNSLNIRLGKTSWWFHIPEFIKPMAKWVDLTGKDWSKPDPITGKQGYTDYIQRSYGFSVDAEALHLYYGIQPGSWSRDDPKNSDHSKCYFLPWNQWVRTKVEFVNWQNLEVAYVSEEVNDKVNFEGLEAGREAVEKVQIKFKDFDGEEITATCHLEEFFYKRGTGWFKWLGWFSKKNYRRLEMRFDKEVGKRKGDWKGGTIDTSVNIDVHWYWRHAFRRFADKEGFTDIQFLDY